MKTTLSLFASLSTLLATSAFGQTDGSILTVNPGAPTAGGTLVIGSGAATGVTLTAGLTTGISESAWLTPGDRTAALEAVSGGTLSLGGSTGSYSDFSGAVVSTGVMNLNAIGVNGVITVAPTVGGTLVVNSNTLNWVSPSGGTLSGVSTTIDLRAVTTVGTLTGNTTLTLNSGTLVKVGTGFLTLNGFNTVGPIGPELWSAEAQGRILTLISIGSTGGLVTFGTGLLTLDQNVFGTGSNVFNASALNGGELYPLTFSSGSVVTFTNGVSPLVFNGSFLSGSDTSAAGGSLVPEPGSALLLALGALAFVGKRRRALGK